MGSRIGRQAFQAPSLVRAGVLQPLAAFMQQSGVSLSVLASKAGLARLPSEGMAFYPYGDGVELIQQAAIRSGIEYLGYMIAKEGGLRSLGAYGEFIASAPTLYRAILRANALVKWISPSLSLSIEQEGQRVVWSASHPEETSKFIYHGYLHTICLFLEVVRQVVPAGQQPLEIRVGHRALSSPALEALIEAPVRFVEHEWAVVFPRRFLVSPLVPPSWARQEHSYATLERAALRSDTAMSLRALVRSLLYSGQANEEQLSRILDLPKRSFQRHIKTAVGMPFRDFLAEIRFGEARRLMAEPSNKLRDVAAALGYTEQANFTRAFAKWSGVSPSEYRLELQDGNPGSWREMTSVPAEGQPL